MFLILLEFCFFLHDDITFVKNWQGTEGITIVYLHT